MILIATKINLSSNSRWLVGLSALRTLEPERSSIDIERLKNCLC